MEQKNGSIVRQIVGYDRFEGEVAYPQLAELYRALRLYVNVFQPSLKRVLKRRDGSRVYRRYDTAQTPLRRLLTADVLDEGARARLRAHRGARSSVYAAAPAAVTGGAVAARHHTRADDARADRAIRPADRGALRHCGGGARRGRAPPSTSPPAPGPAPGARATGGPRGPGPVRGRVGHYRRLARRSSRAARLHPPAAISP